jgi:hypothetical protein
MAAPSLALLPMVIELLLVPFFAFLKPGLNLVEGTLDPVSAMNTFGSVNRVLLTLGM